MVYAEFGGQTECIMGNSKIVNGIECSSRSPLPRWGAWTSVLMVASHAGVFRGARFSLPPLKTPA